MVTYIELTLLLKSLLVTNASKLQLGAIVMTSLRIHREEGDLKDEELLTDSCNSGTNL